MQMEVFTTPCAPSAAATGGLQQIVGDARRPLSFNVNSRLTGGGGGFFTSATVAQLVLYLRSGPHERGWGRL